MGVEETLIPEEIGRGIERFAMNASGSLFETGERSIGWQRDASGASDPSKALVRFIEEKLLGDRFDRGTQPPLTPQGIKIEITGASFGEIEIQQQGEGHAGEHVKPCTRRLDIHLNRDRFGDIVAEGGERDREDDPCCRYDPRTTRRAHAVLLKDELLGPASLIHFRGVEIAVRISSDVMHPVELSGVASAATDGA